MHPIDYHPGYHLALFLAGLLVLLWSGKGAVSHLDIISRRFRLEQFNAAFLIMAISTSLPELFVGIAAAFSDVSILSAGNVLGSNIADMTLVLGTVVLLAGRLVFTTGFLRDGAVAFIAVALLPFFLLLDGNLGRFEGLILIGIFVLFMRHILRHHEVRFSETKKAPQRSLSAQALSQFALSILGLLVASHVVVRSGISLAAELGISPFVLGLLAVAIGTSLPELIFEYLAVRKGKPDFAIGDSAGSVICNATLVLGVTALINPIQIQPATLKFPGIITILALILFLLPLRRHKQIPRIVGIGMLVLYGVFLFGEFA